MFYEGANYKPFIDKILGQAQFYPGFEVQQRDGLDVPWNALININRVAFRSLPGFSPLLFVAWGGLEPPTSRL